MSISPSSSDSAAAGRQSNFTLWLILAVCVLPFVAAVLLYLFWRPTSFVNYGELLEPMPLTDLRISTKQGQPFGFGDLRGQWIFLMVDRGACDAYCQKKLYWTRQVRLTQGPDQERIARVWLVSDGVAPPPELVRQNADAHAVLMSDPQTLRDLPPFSEATDHVYLVDPFGNLMMRYPRDLDPDRMKGDVSRLMRISKGWHQLPR